MTYMQVKYLCGWHESDETFDAYTLIW